MLDEIGARLSSGIERIFTAGRILSHIETKKLAAVYFILATLIVVSIHEIVPPFFAPDEFAHALRVDSLASGNLIPTPDTNGLLGVMVDGALVDVLRILGPGAGGPAPPPKAASIEAARLMWSGKYVHIDIPNTAQYGPILYLPQAAGLALGRAAGLPVVGSCKLARLLAGLTAVFIAAIAIAVAERGRALLLVMLSAPMFLFLAASLSQDGMLLAVSALFAALAAGSRPAEAPARSWVAWLCALLLIMARPPYALLCVLLVRGRAGRPPGLWLRSPDGPLAPVLICGITVLWLIWSGAASQPNFARDPKVDPHAQLAGLLGHPAVILRIAAGTLANQEIPRLIPEIIGVMGALAIVLPRQAYYLGNFAILAAIAACALQPSRRSPLGQLIFAIILLLSIGAIYAALYLTWTPVNETFVKGVQGRYLLPFILALPCVVPSLVPTRWRDGTRIGTVLDAAATAGGIAAWVVMIGVAVDALFVLHAAYGGS